MEALYWHAVILAPASNDCDDTPLPTARLRSKWRERREAAAEIARGVLRARGVTEYAFALACDDTPNVAHDRLHGRRPLGPEHIFALDRDDAIAVFDAWARGKRAA